MRKSAVKRKPVNIITQASDNHLLKIYINGSLHLCIKQTRLTGLQSWIEGERKKKYFIEYYTGKTEIITEYHDKQMWLDILSILDNK